MRQLIELADEWFRVILMFAASSACRQVRVTHCAAYHVQRREVRVETGVDTFRIEDIFKSRLGLRTIPRRCVLRGVARLAAARALSSGGNCHGRQRAFAS